MLIPSALFTERIIVLKQTRVADGEGGWTGAFTEVASLPARTAMKNLRIGGTSEDVAAGLPRAPDSLVVYANDPQGVITSECRFQVKDGRIFKIVQSSHSGGLTELVGVVVD